MDRCKPASTVNQISVLNGPVPWVFNYRCMAPPIGGQTFRVMSKKQADAAIIGSIWSAEGTATLAASNGQ
jgi:hypothetical protein